jgi:hypothetical protein
MNDHEQADWCRGSKPNLRDLRVSVSRLAVSDQREERWHLLLYAVQHRVQATHAFCVFANCSLRSLREAGAGEGL